MLGTFAFVMDLLTALWAQVLLTGLAEDSFGGFGNLLALLAHELDFGFVGGVRRVTVRTAHFLAG